MKILTVTGNGVIGVDAWTREGLFVSQHPVEFRFDHDERVVVPAGFVFDGASIPARARSFIESLATAANVAFLIHDYAYASGALLLRGADDVVAIERSHADWIALALCTWLELAEDDCLEIYAALRLFGGGAYQRLPVTRTIEDVLARKGS